MATQYALNGVAGLVIRRRARETGRYISLYNAEQGGYDPAGGPWALVCEEHGYILALDTLKLARWHMSNPLGWCEYCSGALEVR